MSCTILNNNTKKYVPEPSSSCTSTLKEFRALGVRLLGDNAEVEGGAVVAAVFVVEVALAEARRVLLRR